MADGKLNFIKTGASAIGGLAGKAVDAAGKAVEGKIPQNITGNEAEQEKLKSAVKVLLNACDFEKYIADFSAAVKEEFRKSLTVESVVSLQENMLMIINKWYRENGFIVYGNDLEDIEPDTKLIIADDKFFKHPD